MDGDRRARTDCPIPFCPRCGHTWPVGQHHVCTLVEVHRTRTRVGPWGPYVEPGERVA